MLAESIAKFIAQFLGNAFVPLSFALLLGPMVVLPLLFLYFLVVSRARARPGLVIGLLVATWASLCWLTLPYLGGYPNLPGLMLLSLLGSGPVHSWWQEIFIHAVNFAVWPLAGWLVFRLRIKLPI